MPFCSKDNPKWWYCLPQPFSFTIGEYFLSSFIPGLSILYFGEDRSAASWAISSTEVVQSFFAFLTSGWLGRISDAIGRKLLLAIGALSNIFPFVVIGLVGWKPEAFILYMVLQMLSGISATQKYTAAAYIADTSSQELRPQRNILAICAVLVGGLFGAVINIATGTQFEISRWLPLVTFILASIYFIIIPESLPEKNRIPWKEAKPYFNAIIHYKKLKQAPNGIVLTVIACFAFAEVRSFWVVYHIYSAFRYDLDARGIQLVVVPVVLGNIIFTFVLPLALKCMRKRTVLLVVVVTNSLSFIIMLVSKSFNLYLVSLFLFGSGSVLLPFTIGLISIEVSPKMQGTIIGTMNAIAELTGAAAILITGVVLATTVDTYIDTFLIFSLIYCIICVVAAVFFYKGPQPYDDNENEVSDEEEEVVEMSQKNNEGSSSGEEPTKIKQPKFEL